MEKASSDAFSYLDECIVTRANIEDGKMICDQIAQHIVLWLCVCALYHFESDKLHRVSEFVQATS